MTKSDLQPGMLAITRTGNEYLVLPGKLFGLTTIGILLSNYEEDLTVSDSSSFDIVQVYVVTAGSVSTIHTPELRKLIWQREEHKYPLYCQTQASILDFDAVYTVEFTDMCTGTVIESNIPSIFPIGYSSDNWIPHTDAMWQPIEPPKASVSTPLSLEEICKILGITIKEVH